MLIIGSTQESCDDPELEPQHEIYVSGNRGQYKSWPAGNEWDICGCYYGAGNPADTRFQVLTPHTILGGIPITVDSVATMYNRVLAHAGCKMPTVFGRDKSDRGLINSIQLHGGKIPDTSMSEVTGGGWPTLSPGYPQPADPDSDAVWSWFETANGSNPAVADSDQYDYLAAGYTQTYTNVEVFENVHDHEDPHVITYIDVN